MREEHGIEAEGLVRTFKGDIRAVDGIDLTVAPGEIYGFLGPNGAGKSTTVHMLTTLLPPTSGTARVAGYDIVKEGPSVRSAIGAALQEAALDGLLTGREHIRLQTRAARHSRAATARPARTSCSAGSVSPRPPTARSNGYSGGMKRRLDLALALAHRPSILFLDEPTTGLDPQSRTALWQEVARLAQGRRRDRLPDHAVPRGGRRPRRSRRDHRPRQDRRRGHTERAKARDRPPDRRGDSRATAPTPPRSPASSSASASRPAARRRALPSGSSAARRSSPRSSARSTPQASRWSTSSCTRRVSTTSSSRRPAARSRAQPRRPTRKNEESEPRGPGRSHRVAGGHPHHAPAGERRLPVRLPDRAARGHLGGTQRGDASSRASRPTRSSPSSSPFRSSRARSSRR